MSTLLSSGISVTESDLISYVPPVSSSIGAFVGHFNWGPADQLINVNSEKTLGSIFGTPKINAGSEASFITSYLTAESFLLYGNSLRVMRSVHSSATNAVSYTQGYADPTTVGKLIQNKDVFDITDYSTNKELIFARYPGKLGNGLEVQFFHADNCPPSDLTVVGDTLAKTCKQYFGKLPATTYWSTKQGITMTNDEVHVIVYDTLGYISGNPNSILETFSGLSLQAGAKTITDSNNYFADVINLGSSYIYINEHREDQLASSVADTFELANANFLFHYGASAAANGDIHTSGNVTASLESPVLLDKENTDINLLFSETFESDALLNTIGSRLELVAESRQDIISFISAPLNLYKLTTNDTKRLAVIAGKTSIDSSYVFFDNTPVYMYNKYTDKYYWVPACGHMAGLCAYTDAVADPWFSPAGLNRGQLRGVSKLAYNAPLSDRDDLYNNNINSLISVPGSGIVLYGDKTGLSHPSSFDRINVRRLFIVVEKACRKASAYQLFELNDEFTQRAFRNTLDPYLRDIRARRGIIDYAIVCDSTNNTPSVVNSNRFVGDIYLKPQHSINYIQLNFIATRDTVTFTEISG